MSFTLIIIMVVALLIILIAGVAWLVYRAGFRVTGAKVKTPVLEADLARPPAGVSTAPAPAGPVITQKAGEAGKITKSGISAPADAAAHIEQQATDKGQINDSPINLT
ncbi:MAG: hypothetical protein JW953_01710 [Anaerolineae bacterium]|nr:hypothetical protein [Anaerolineae bacterium]